MKVRSRLALSTIILSSVGVSGCSRQSTTRVVDVPNRSVTHRSEISFGQPIQFFVSKWGKADRVEKSSDYINGYWTVGTLRAVVVFRDGLSEKIVFTLPTWKWSDDQISGALRSAGNGWKDASPTQTPGLIGYGSGANWALGAIVIGIQTWVSDEGSSAQLNHQTMTISSASLLLRLATEESERRARTKAVPRF